MDGTVHRAPATGNLDVFDLPAALMELREASLISAAWIGLANRAALDGQPAGYVLQLVAQAEDAAGWALERACALEAAAALAAGSQGRS